MRNILLSIDWDYFIPIKEEWTGSYLENRRNIIGLWYKRYFNSKLQGINIESGLNVDKDIKCFWKYIKKLFIINKSTPMYITESHKLSYDIAKEYNCTEVYSFDAHSDLGYGGLESLKFEVNCANWLGKLLSQELIKKANIIYSKYTKENKIEFDEISNKYNVDFVDISTLKDNVEVSAIHICRSGAWTPPWLDNKFFRFVKEISIPYKNIDCETREWDTENLTLADQLDYMYI